MNITQLYLQNKDRDRYTTIAAEELKPVLKVQRLTAEMITWTVQQNTKLNSYYSWTDQKLHRRGNTEPTGVPPHEQ